MCCDAMVGETSKKKWRRKNVSMPLLKEKKIHESERTPVVVEIKKKNLGSIR